MRNRIPVALLGFLVLAATEPPAPLRGHDVGADPWRFKALLYYRADAFRLIVAEAMCGGGGVARERFDSLSARLEHARARLAARSRSPMFHPSDRDVVNARCSGGSPQIALRQYEEKVREVEAAAEAGIP